MTTGRILLLGLGNPIMGDDGVGIVVVRMLKQKIHARPDLEFKELSVGGIRLIEEMLGYETVFIIDSVASKETSGQIHEFSPEQFKESQYESSPHTTNFVTALGLYKKLEPSRVPGSIRIFTIDIDSHFTFSENLSPPVQTAAVKLTEQIAREVERISS
jgi:hydrogenase maturation protease